jgi:hypothetical protein
MCEYMHKCKRTCPLIQEAAFFNCHLLGACISPFNCFETVPTSVILQNIRFSYKLIRGKIGGCTASSTITGCHTAYSAPGSSSLSGNTAGRRSSFPSGNTAGQQRFAGPARYKFFSQPTTNSICVAFKCTGAYL